MIFIKCIDYKKWYLLTSNGPTTPTPTAPTAPM